MAIKGLDFKWYDGFFLSMLATSMNGILLNDGPEMGLLYMVAFQLLWYSSPLAAIIHGETCLRRRQAHHYESARDSISEFGKVLLSTVLVDMLRVPELGLGNDVCYVSLTTSIFFFLFINMLSDNIMIGESREKRWRHSFKNFQSSC
ncbi:hypothetical protein Tco_1101913 [Tanacetum coccineum]